MPRDEAGFASKENFAMFRSKEAAMRAISKWTLTVVVALGGFVLPNGCRQGPGGSSSLGPEEIRDLLTSATLPAAAVPEVREIQDVLDDFHPWVNAKRLSGPERKSFVEFCRFLAVRRRCDDAITAKGMTDKEAVQVTQPLIDQMAALGKPTEDVLILLLGGRKKLDSGQRKLTLCGEDPEIYAAITLWNMKSAPAVPLFMELAQNKEIENRAVFIRGLGRIGDPKALDLLKDLAAQEPAAEVQAEARMAITDIEKSATSPKK
jgi:hypothetical protein